MANENYQDMDDQTGAETEQFEAENAVNRMLDGLRGDGCTVQPPQWGPGDATGAKGEGDLEGMRDDEDDNRSSHIGSPWSD